MDAETFTADASDFSFQWLYARFNNSGYIVKENRHDVRLPETAFSENEFVIHAPNARLHSKLVSRRLFLYPDSEAVFFRKEEKKGREPQKKRKERAETRKRMSGAARR